MIYTCIWSINVSIVLLVFRLAWSVDCGWQVLRKSIRLRKFIRHETFKYWTYQNILWISRSVWEKSSSIWKMINFKVFKPIGNDWILPKRKKCSINLLIPFRMSNLNFAKFWFYPNNKNKLPVNQIWKTKDKLERKRIRELPERYG